MNLNETNTSSIEYAGDSIDLIKEYDDYCEEKENSLISKNKEKEKEICFFFFCYFFQHSLPILTFSGGSLEIVCECKSKIENRFTFEEASKKFLFNNKHLNKDACFKCDKEGHRNKKFKYYCPKCKIKHLCKFCLEKCNHEKERIILIKLIKPIDEMIKRIEIKLKNCNKIDYYLKMIIESIINTYRYNPYHYSYYANFKAIHDYLLSNWP